MEIEIIDNKNSKFYKITNFHDAGLLKLYNRIILMTAKPVSIKRPEYKSIWTVYFKYPH